MTLFVRPLSAEQKVCVGLWLKNTFFVSAVLSLAAPELGIEGVAQGVAD
jgi:hypothetical protein